MAQRNKKDRRQEKKLRESEFFQPLSSILENLPSLPEENLEESDLEKSQIDVWWDVYEAADGQERVRMIREQLQAIQPGDEWYEDVVPDAIFELELELPEAEYIAFLEELRTKQPAFFDENAGWFVRSMAFFYVAEQRWDDLDRIVLDFADRMTDFDEPCFSLMSLIRLTGRAEPAQRLVTAALRLNEFDELMPCAFGLLMEWALFEPIQNCLREGSTDEALSRLYQAAVDFGCDDFNRVRKHLQAFVLHLSGKNDPWTRKKLHNNNAGSDKRLNLLSANFMQWLSSSRGFEPLVADELRLILIDTMETMECEPTEFFGGLGLDDLEPALAQQLGPMSLEQFHAPAGIIAFQHFYSFLAESGIIDDRKRDSVHAVCDRLWKKVKKALHNDWKHYKFLEKYLPSTGTSGHVA